jgi:hypothetical protein
VAVQRSFVPPEAERGEVWAENQMNTAIYGVHCCKHYHSLRIAAPRSMSKMGMFRQLTFRAEN